MLLLLLVDIGKAIKVDTISIEQRAGVSLTQQLEFM
nr:MAG TPA: hypothetical protein [Caudoviricetes sp.]DAS34213.1 MAG TPA: hypothetical protein [Caudoviricetes sp.]